jgi:protein phosphatase
MPKDTQHFHKICWRSFSASSSFSESHLRTLQKSIFGFLGASISLGSAVFVYSELIDDDTVQCSELVAKEYPWDEVVKRNPFYWDFQAVLHSKAEDTDVVDIEASPVYYEPTSSISEGMLEVVEAGVNKATEWEKKAKAVVNKLTKPNRYDISVRALKGGRLSMEDTYCIHDQGRFVGVFDGHGGAGVSTYLSSSMYEKVERHLERVSSSPSSPSIKEITKSLLSALSEIEDEVLQKDDFQYQGSTAVAVYVHEDPRTGERTIISANVGDSRAVLSRGSVAVTLTRDHKPDDTDEKKRILSMGETIEWDSYCNVSRVRNLSLSRAIGDRFAKPVVSAEPEIKLFPLSELPVEEGHDRNDFVILASDGLWDVMTSQNCVNFVMDRLTPSNQQTKHMSPSELERQTSTRRKRMSRDLADEAIRRGSCDNVCVVILWLNS